MGDTLATSIIPKRTDLPRGRFNFLIEAATEEHHEDGRRYLKVVNRVTEAAATALYTGMLHTENFYLGTESDPEGDDPETQKASVGAAIFTRLMDACGFDTTQDVSISGTLAAMLGLQYTGRVDVKERKDKITKQGTGRMDSQIGRYYKFGEIAPGLDDGGPVQPTPRRTTTAPQPRAAAPRPVARPNGPVAAPRPAPRPAAPALPAGFEITEE